LTQIKLPPPSQAEGLSAQLPSRLPGLAGNKTTRVGMNRNGATIQSMNPQNGRFSGQSGRKRGRELLL
jgi:hypothetical protein